ncbi:unnamed protein product [Rhizoctonia solani]|uniref:Uncharacterized protein n=1 Tax=Rhizoctonia solani TaxID=456999 RepID=A0A8H3I6K1_9AGAM|nr:unnamed protein product [Rhizoctonia solani]
MRIIASAVTALSLATLVLGQASSSQQAQTSSQQPQTSAAASGNGSSSGSAAATTAAPSVVVITSFQQSVSLSGTNRALVTISIPVVISSTVAQAQPTGSTGGNGTQQPGGSATASTSTTPTTLPTAASTIGVNGQGGQVAPSPGGSNPATGPDDNYISGARQLAIGGMTVMLGFGVAMAAQMM